MSFLNRWGSAPETRSAEAVYAAALRSFGVTSDRNVSLSLTPDAAMKHSTVNACVSKIANVSTMDANPYRQVEDRLERTRQTELLAEPSAEIDDMEWRRQVIVGWLTRGTTFAYITKADQYGYPQKAELLPAECVTVRKKYNAAFSPTIWKVDGQVLEPYPNGPLWVMRGLHTKTGIPVGISPIEMALGAIGLGLAAEDFGASWFYDGAHPSAVLESEDKIDKDQAATIKARFIDAIRGSREPAVLGQGLKYKAIQVAANESQFLETLERNVATVCRFFLMPPEEVGSSSGGSSVTYANVDSRFISLQQGTLHPYIRRLEKVLTRVTPKPLTVQLDIADSIRTDLKTRTDMDATDVRAGIRSRDEIRADRGMPPIPDGSGAEHLWPPMATTIALPSGDKPNADGPSQPA